MKLRDQIKRGNVLMAKPIEGYNPCYLLVTAVDYFSFDYQEIDKDRVNGRENWDKVFRVPITDDILTTCDLVKSDVDLLKVIMVDYIGKHNLEYVDQLQNLYQSLTGTELKFKL